MVAENLNLIHARERKGLGTGMALYAESGTRLGALIWATTPMPLNSSFGPQQIGEDGFTRLECEGQAYRLDFEGQYDGTGRRTGRRFLLRSLTSSEVLAEGKCVNVPGILRPPVITLELPVQGCFESRWKWGRGHWDLLSLPPRQVLGYIEEPAALSLKRELVASLPLMTRAQQAFCIYVFCFINYMGSSSVPK